VIGGEEPDANYSPFEGCPPQMLSQDRRHVMAKAENLELMSVKIIMEVFLPFLEVVGGVKVKKLMTTVPNLPRMINHDPNRDLRQCPLH
jgi:hypothetical protein